MKEWYFYQEQGKTLGPLSREEVRGRITNGRLKLYDLLYFEGDDQWRMAAEFKEFKDDFSKSPHVTTQGRGWVVLQRRSPESQDFLTSGPWSQEDLVLKLKAGKILYTDYAWREGLKSWKRLSTLEEFSGSAPSRELTHEEKIMATPERELLRDVMQLKRVPLEKDVPPPEAREAEGRPRSEPPRVSAPPPERKMESLLPQPPPLPGSPPVPENGVFEERRAKGPSSERRRSRRRKKDFWRMLSWLDYMLVALIVSGLVTAGYLLARANNWFERAEGGAAESEQAMSPVESAEDWPEPSESGPEDPGEWQASDEPALPAETALPSGPVAPSETASSQAVQKIPAEKAVPALPPKPKVAKRFRSDVVKGSLSLAVRGGKNKLSFTVVSGSSEPVSLQIIGPPGQVVGAASYYKYMRASPGADGLVPFETKQLSLPAGRYIARVSRGDLVREQKFSLGTTQSDFNKQIAASRKMHSQVIWQERVRLMKLTEQLEAFIQQKLRQPKSAVKWNDLAELANVKKASGGQYVIFDSWWELKEIFDEAKAAPSKDDLARVQDFRRRLALMTVWK